MKAFAKINLALFITNRLPNGYHTLETVFAPINWFDELEVQAADRLELTCSNLDIPTDETNLCCEGSAGASTLYGHKRWRKNSSGKAYPCRGWTGRRFK
jgi:4-diphosphocytidyl-2C-methyl-D-erythritol kinase